MADAPTARDEKFQLASVVKSWPLFQSTLGDDPLTGDIAESVIVEIAEEPSEAGDPGR